MHPQTIIRETAAGVLTQSQVDDLRLASSKLSGAKRRAFQAEITLKYCDGRPRLAETIFGWGRKTVQLGLDEKRTGLICVGAQSGYSGNYRWEERYPEAADALKRLAEDHTQPDPNLEHSMADTRLTAPEAISQLRSMGFSEEQLPKPSTMRSILNRLGYRLSPEAKGKLQKNNRH